MPKDSVTGIIMATLLEAKPFVEHLSLKAYAHEPFEAYKNGHIRLVVSGMGKSDAAMAATWLILTEHPSQIFNLGAAGAMNHTHNLGETLHISKVIEPDRPILGTDRFHEHIPDMLQGFATAVLATQDKPVILPEERDKLSARAQLADMEGAAVVQTCRRFKIPCYLFKFVSDTPENHCIRENIECYRESFCQSVMSVIAEELDEK
jgi:nucleoside phosphorylase